MKGKIIGWLRRFYTNKSLQRVGGHWGRVTKADKASTTIKNNWWQFAQIQNHIDAGVYEQGATTGWVARALNEYKILPCERAVSVGCGIAKKEIQLLEMGLVKHFDLYEVSAERLREAKALAQHKGVLEQINFHQNDVFSQTIKNNHYDLVYWSNSLHHMFDVPQAVKWSKDVLKSGGGFMMDDFIGPSRFQWSKTQLEYATRIRQCFANTHYLIDPDQPNKSLPIKITKPSRIGMYCADPSEAADSDRIIESLKQFFPNVQIHKTGGAVYHLALNGMLANFDEEQDQHLIKLLMMIDDLLIEQGESHYAIAFATK